VAEQEYTAIIEMLRQLRQDFADERDAAHTSRAATHKRIDDLTDRVGRMDTTMAVAGQVQAQVRGEVDGLRKAVSDLAPTVDEWRRIRQLGLGIVGLMTAGGLTVGAILAAGGNWLVDMIRHWLRLQ